MEKANVNDVALFFIALAQDSGEQLTHMKLQKLVYYSQAWYLGMYGESLFNSSIEAWQHGPVCPELYHKFKSFGSNPIELPFSCPDVAGCISVVKPNLSDEVYSFLEQIADDYMDLSAFALRNMTHKERPWIDAFAANQGEITVESMVSYYSELVISEEELTEANEAYCAIQDGEGTEWKPGMFL